MIFFSNKKLYLIIKSVKCIICKTTYNTYIHTNDNTYVRQYSVAKVDYRGAAAPKKNSTDYKINQTGNFKRGRHTANNKATSKRVR